MSNRIAALFAGLRERLFARWRKKHAPAIIVLTRSDFIPADHGAAVKIERTAHSLSRSGLDVFVVTDNRKCYYHFKNGYLQEIRLPAWTRWFSTPKFVIRHRINALGIPKKEAFLYLPVLDMGFIVRALYVRLKHRASAFMAEFPAYARPAEVVRFVFGGHLVIVEHNIEFTRLTDQFPETTEPARRWLKNTELSLCGSADAVITVSAADRDTLIKEGIPAEKISHIPLGVDLDAFTASLPEDVRQRYHIHGDSPILVFHGIYRYLPNLEALRFLAKEILPRLNAMGLYPKVLAIGRDPPDESIHPDIIFTGPVQSIAPWLLAADIAVVPLLKGGGTRMKIIDYFAAGLPLVSTSKGIEGVPVTNHYHAEIHDEPADFAAAIAALVASPVSAKQLAKNGHSIAIPLDWTLLAQQYRKVLKT